MSSVLFTEEGTAALAAAAGCADPAGLAAATALRKRFPAELAAAAVDQVVLRRRARAKFGDPAERMWFTHDGVEQASRPMVAQWRAQRLVAAGVKRVVDLCCGIGADAMAMVSAGLDVVCVELDGLTAQFAARNLGLVASEVVLEDGSGQVRVKASGGGGRARVVVDDATTRVDDLAADPETLIFIDPARRDSRGRSWNVEDLHPGWDFIGALLERANPVCVKLGPGLPREIIPDGLEACWVSDRGDVLEVGLWKGVTAVAGESGGRFRSTAMLLPDRHGVVGDDADLEVRAPGRFLLEPDGAVIRARGLGAVASDAWLLAPGIAYLSCDEVAETPLATCFEILEVMDAGEKNLRAWVRDQQIGTLEIKKRGVDVDPAVLRRKLKPKGPRAATLVLTRTVDGVRALVVRRV